MAAVTSCLLTSRATGAKTWLQGICRHGIIRMAARTRKREQMESNQSLQAIIAATTASVLEALHLDNCKDTTDVQSCAELQKSCLPDDSGGIDMPSAFRKRIVLSDGTLLELTGKSLDDALDKYFTRNQLQPKTIPSFREYAADWLTTFHDAKASARWQRETAHMMERHILPFFGSMRLCDIHTPDIQRFFNEKRRYSTSYIKHMKYLISNIMESAMEDQLITSNPVSSKRLTMPKRVKEREALNLEQVMDILAHIPDLKDPEQERLLMLLLFTGMRRGELIALRWEDVDLKHRVIHVRHAVEFTDNNHPVLKGPKSKAGKRDIPITDELLPFLDPGPDQTYVIGGNDEPITRRAFEWMYNQIRKKIDLHGASAHTLRHTYITAASYRLSPKEVQGLAGHSKFDITMNRYAHTGFTKIEETARQMAGLYTPICTE